MTVLLEGVYAEYRAHLASRGLAPPVGLKVEVCGPPLVPPAWGRRTAYR